MKKPSLFTAKTGTFALGNREWELNLHAISARDITCKPYFFRGFHAKEMTF